MAACSLGTRLQATPPLNHYITFSIDVAATLELYCDGGNWKSWMAYRPGSMLATARSVRPVQQGLTKISSLGTPLYVLPCVPILPATAHPTSRKPLAVMIPLPWDNCYHPTCYDLFIRVPIEWQDDQHSSRVKLSPSLLDALREDRRYGELRRAGLDDETDNASETDSQICKTFFAKIPGSDKSKEDAIFVPVMRIDHVLSNVPEISDPSQLFGDLDLFQEIVQEYQLARYGSAVFPQPEPEMDITPFPDDYSVYSSESAASGTSTEDLDSRALDLLPADESDVSSNPTAPVPPRKGKWRVKSLFRRAITNITQFLKGHKFSAKL
ncbi:hypothetical protein ARMSODRAFT_968693 [Armillaria solidipes]|uniref:Uncharacterized protein n=1 Tax=Armillaria solidipes TaxID=1076256 RepID=A0A2H3CHD4_9AGAR|nr:hypothetical protein ARMSODRAFT_968693 [Armillaria solidipes]